VKETFKNNPSNSRIIILAVQGLTQENSTFGCDNVINIIYNSIFGFFHQKMMNPTAQDTAG